MEKNQTSGNFLSFVLKGSLIALAFSLVFILVFAFFIRFFAVSDSAITVVVQIIKGLSVILGVYFVVRKNKENGFLIGFLLGFLFTIFSFVVFSILDNFTFEISRTILNDLIFSSLIGGIFGIIAVNLK